MATFWRYVRIQLAVFAFGIVGPILLVVYFAAQADPSVKPLYWIGLFITAADVMIALAVTNSVSRSEDVKPSARRAKSSDE